MSYFAAHKLIDENGTAYGVKHVSNKIRTSSMPYLYDIAEGNVSGHVAWAKFGFNADVDNTEETVWEPGGAYVWPSAAMQMSVKSTDNTNDNAGGTGVLKVKIYYLDTDYAEAVEEVTLSGTTWVDTTAINILRINSFRASDTGTGKAAAGTITIADKATRAIVYAQISAGYTVSRQAIYTVPAAKVLYITSVTISAASSTANQFSRTTLRTTYDDIAEDRTDFFFPHAEFLLSNFTIQRVFELPEYCPAKTDIIVSSIGNAANSNINISAALRGWIE